MLNMPTGQAWVGEDDMEMEPAPVASFFTVGEMGEVGSSVWFYGSTLGFWKVLKPCDLLDQETRGSFMGMWTP